MTARNEQSTLFDFMPLDTSRGFSIERKYISHPFIEQRSIEYRKFQFDLAQLAVQKNLLVVLPTGLGKTVIALLASAEMLRLHGGKVLFLAPTRPLAMQHLASFRKALVIKSSALFTGSTPAEERKKLWSGNRIIFATPQVIANDLQNGLYDLSSVTFCIFDEAHRAVGNYSYVGVAAACREAGVRILALTASPGAKFEKVEGILAALGIESVETRDRGDTDVIPYVKEVGEEIIRVPLNEEMKEMLQPLNSMFREKVASIQRMGFLRYKKAQFISRKDLLSVRGLALSSKRKGGYMFGVMHNTLLAIHTYHCAELLESQGVQPLAQYMDRMKPGKSKAEKGFLRDPRIAELQQKLAAYDGISHPKLLVLEQTVRKQLDEKKGSMIMIFTQYRDTIDTIVRHLRLQGISCEKFVGQASKEGDEGMSQKEQAEVIRGFASGRFSVLVSSSIGEEGIDIPDVDMVIFYEPVPSEIRTIQRKGRTGRSSAGRVITLVAEGTRDESYLAASRKRVFKMKRIVSKMKEKA